MINTKQLPRVDKFGNHQPVSAKFGIAKHFASFSITIILDVLTFINSLKVKVEKISYEQRFKSHSRHSAFTRINIKT